MSSASVYITYINKALRNIKLDVLADYVQRESIKVIIVINKWPYYPIFNP